MMKNNAVNDWNKYWSKKKGISHIFFDKIAFFYRESIIPRILNYFLKKNYKNDSLLLHAGCGSGRVDKKTNKKFKLLSMDISMPALKINNFSRMLVQGDILRLPIKAMSIDGIYNLGVMEHFTENEIIEILKEFSRVLKPHGKIILFWPPEFGLSEIFLNTVYFILNKILKKNIKFSPDELTKIKSYSHVKCLSKRANLKIIDYYFGPRDFFTYVVVTLGKNL